MNASLAHDLIAQHGSPLYAYNLAEVSTRAVELLDSLPQGSSLYYSFKANPLPSIAEKLRQHGVLAEITSTGELDAALAAGHREGMVGGGPGKTERTLKAMLKHGVRQFSCESFQDAQRISKAAQEHRVQVSAMIRVNPSQAPDARMAMSGVESQFGFDEALLTSEAKAKLHLPAIRWTGVHVYFGTQIASVEALRRNTECALSTAARVADILGFEVETVNAGGGFPWPYAHDAPAPNLDGLRQALTEVWEQSSLSSSAKLAFESGRYLSASSGTLLTTVLDVKQAGQKTFVCTGHWHPSSRGNVRTGTHSAHSHDVSESHRTAAGGNGGGHGRTTLQPVGLPGTRDQTASNGTRRRACYTECRSVWPHRQPYPLS